MLYTLKSHFKFNKSETFSLIIIFFVLGFIFSFNQWDASDASVGLRNLILATAIVGISLLVKLSLQKLASLKVGYSAEFQTWIPGVLLSTLLVLLSNGRLMIPIIGAVSYSLIERQRIGHKYQAINFKTIAILCAIGTFTHIILAALMKWMSSYFLTDIMMQGMKVNLLFAVVSVLPIPFIMQKTYFSNSEEKTLNFRTEGDTSEGLMLLFSSRLGYVCVLAFTITSSLLLLAMQPITALVLSLIYAIIILTFYYIEGESTF